MALSVRSEFQLSSTLLHAAHIIPDVLPVINCSDVVPGSKWVQCLVVHKSLALASRVDIAIERLGTAGWAGRGERDGKVYARNRLRYAS